jgi:hypothetical protein
VKTSQWADALRESNYKVKFTSSPVEALHELTQRKCEAIILGLLFIPIDLYPYLSYSDYKESDDYLGFALAKWVRDMYPTMPVMIISRGYSKDASCWCSNNPPAMMMSWGDASAKNVVEEINELFKIALQMQTDRAFGY